MAHSSLTRQHQGMLPYLALTAAALLASSVVAGADPEPERACYTTAETREKILAHGLFEPFHAMRNAAARLQAQAIGVKLCRWQDALVYEVSLLRHDGRVIHLSIDAKTGQPFGSKTGHDVKPGPSIGANGER